MNFNTKVCLVALVFLFLLFLAGSAAAFCTSDNECSAITCVGGAEQNTQLCNRNTGNCYCGPESCGNESCEAAENFTNCPADCTAGCGNSVCDSAENTATCPADCVAECGNRLCEAGENEVNCAVDCLIEARCCEYETDAYSGQSRCILWCAVCGDSLCEANKGEDSLTCSFDCGAFGCGDGTCSEELGEDSVSCPEDCGYLECMKNADCKGIRTCDYVVGENYSKVEVDYFNVCSCSVGSCEVTLEVKRICGDTFCSSKESCDPFSENFCGEDCSTCVLPDLIVEDAAVSENIVAEGETIEVSALIGNIGSAVAKPFKVSLLEKSPDGKEEASQQLEELYLTSISVSLEDIIIYLEGGEESEGEDESIVLFQEELVEKTALTPSSNNGKVPLEVNFVITVRSELAASVEKYEIDWQGDGIFDLSFTPPTSQVLYTYEEPGTHRATLRTVFTDGRPDIQRANVLALANPASVSFTIDTEGKCGDNVYYINANPDGAVNEISEENNWQKVEFSVVCPIHPTGLLDAVPVVGRSPLRVQFDGSGSYDNNGSIASYRFDFGDGSATVEGPSATTEHTYTENGVYEAVLTVVSTSGMKGFSSVEIVVGADPIAKIVANPMEGTAPLNVQLDASRSVDPDGEITEYEWTVGGESFSGGMLQRTFNLAGTYTVGLKVTDNDGFSDEDEAEISVFISEKADLAVDAVEFEGNEIGRNESIKLKVKVKNIDGGGAGAFKVELRQGNKDAPVIDDASVSSLASLEEKEVELEFASGPELGSFDYFIILDPDNFVEESDTINNTELVVFSVVLEEICNNSIDDDVDGYVDEGCDEKCYDYLDNDGDGLIDEGCSEICGNTADDDNDGQVDEGCEAVSEEIPNNNRDDDLDGYVDEGFLEICGNNTDDDADGEVDEGCDWTQATISGENIVLSVAGEVDVGEEQVIKLTHPTIGNVANAEVVVISPTGKVITLVTNELGQAMYAVTEEGEYEIRAYKYAMAADGGFAALGFWLRMERRAFGMPIAVFGPVIDEFPLLIMVLIILSLIAGVLSYERSEGLFEERVRTKAEEKRKNLIKALVAVAVFLVPLGINRIYSFNFGVIAGVIEIIVLFLLIYSEKRIEKPWVKG